MGLTAAAAPREQAPCRLCDIIAHVAREGLEMLQPERVFVAGAAKLLYKLKGPLSERCRTR
jgi:hypothetical protein